MELISIVVAVYNAEKTLTKCIDSLINQTYKETQIILVNDCSKDGSLKICYDYEINNSNIMVINNSHNLGVSATRNNGIKAATGKYICFVDSDDYLDECYLEKMYKCRKKYGVMPICGFRYYDELNKLPYKDYIWSKGNGYVSIENSFELYDEIHLAALWNKLFDKDLIDVYNVKFDEKLSMGEDLRFSVEYLKAINADKVYVLASPLYNYLKINENSLMSKVGLTDINSSIDNLRLIKSLVEGIGYNVDFVYEQHLEKLKTNFIYHISRSKLLSNEEKLNKIRIFKPDYTKRELRKEKLKILKEKIVVCFFGR